MESKKPVQSKVLWFNILTIVSMTLGSLLANDDFRELIGSNYIALIIAVNLINVILRFYTDKPIEAKENKPKTTNTPLDKIDEANAIDSF